ncbi:MAG: hypothetical protein P1P89_22530 [Desulfobacterales bacterium]|nr:hypothetical protein [Desulfobacterales bacterium]
MKNMILKALLTWIGIAFAETLHGILRVKLLNHRLGARRVGVFTGSVIILIIGWFTVPWIGPSSNRESMIVGFFWLALMLSFDVAFGRLVFHFSWRRIASDFDVMKGNLLLLGMVPGFRVGPREWGFRSFRVGPS